MSHISRTSKFGGPRFAHLVATRVLIAALLLGFRLQAYGQVDLGPRPGPADAGGPFDKLNDNEQKPFWAGWERFKRVYSVSGNIERGAGLGPTFNGNSCATCHAQPAAGGSSPSPRSPQVRQLALQGGRLALAQQINPQIVLARLDRVPGDEQVVPSFIITDGPVRVARFIIKPDGSPDGSVHDIYTVAGRTDAPTCNLPQPDFAQELTRGNVVFRIPSPTFGAGLIESIPDATLVANLNSTADRRHALAIGGRFNRSANDGTISRFGWKAQNKSLLIFAAESFNVEMGVTSEAFPNKRNETPGCVLNALPEDRTKLEISSHETNLPSDLSSDVVNFAAFMRLSAPPTPATHTPSEMHGQSLFSQVGCILCHSASLTTSASAITGMSNTEIHPYSDYALHHMGPGLADHICQGAAAGDEFRTAPLWGIGQRLFFLHDGRTNDLLVAITEHASAHLSAGPRLPFTCGHETQRSEADGVVRRFNSLSSPQKQDILNFLRSL
jgi:CxxC motif-containing protein (DUF1111 family)